MAISLSESFELSFITLQEYILKRGAKYIDCYKEEDYYTLVTDLKVYTVYILENINSTTSKTLFKSDKNVIVIYVYLTNDAIRFLENKRVELFYYLDLRVNIFKTWFYKDLTIEKVNLNCSDKETALFPCLLMDDPIRKAFNLISGDVIKYQNDNYLYYRRVV